MSRPSTRDPKRPPRVVLLGASNLTRGIAGAVAVARSTLGSPLELLIAMGHGRSYGMTSTVLGRTLPGILECGLWDALADGGGPTYALLTDIGNDVMYGAPVPDIAAWLEQCLDRLRAAGARITLGRLPMVSLERVSPRRYAVARAILFPSAKLSFESALASARALDERLAELAEASGAEAVEQPGRWYRVDPIHIRRRHLTAAWMHMAAGWADGPPPRLRMWPSPRRWLSLRLATPQRWWLLGARRGRSQPARCWADGTTVSLF